MSERHAHRSSGHQQRRPHSHGSHRARDDADAGAAHDDTRDANELAAAALRAELMGDDDEAARLRALMNAPPPPPPQPQQQQQQRVAHERERDRGDGDGDDDGDDDGRARLRRLARDDDGDGEAGRRAGHRLEREVERENEEAAARSELVMYSDRARLASARAGANWGGRADARDRRGNAREYGSSGERERYFADDDVDMKTLLARERAEGVADMDRSFARSVMKSRGAFRASNADDFDDLNMSRFDANARMSEEERAARARERAINEHKKIVSIQDRCAWCLESARAERNMIVTTGAHTYLALPSRGRLVKGHCFIVPNEHVAAMKSASEDTVEEVRNFQKCLVKMFAKQNRGVVFLETVMSLHRRPHTVIECVPLEADLYQVATGYFKKALLDCDTKWESNKRVIDTSGKRIQNAVPEGFAYFHVDFGARGGYAHVIEDERAFGRDFGRQVIIGMMELTEDVLRQRERASSSVLEAQVDEFKTQFRAFDWTRLLYDEQLSQTVQQSGPVDGPAAMPPGYRPT